MSQTKVEYSRIQEIINQLTYVFNVIEGTTTTTCHAFYDGFSIGYGLSACVDPKNFDKDKGEKYAKERAVADATNNLWLCEGYALKFHNYVAE